MNFKELFAHFKEMKHYFIAAALVFAFSMYMGWVYSDLFTQFLENQVKGIKNLSQSISNSENAQLKFFFIIYLNNAIKAVLFVFLGLLLGVLPLFMLVANGMILGYVLSLEAHESTLNIILKGILPHGIIEIPAILLSCAYGIKLGMLVWKSGFELLLPNRPRSAGSELAYVLKLTKPLSVVIVVALFLAAVIESTLTYWLMKS